MYINNSCEQPLILLSEVSIMNYRFTTGNRTIMNILVDLVLWYDFLDLVYEFGVPCLSSGWDSMLPLQGAWVQPLVRELRSHMPCSMVKKFTNTKKERKKEKKMSQWWFLGAGGKETWRIVVQWLCNFSFAWLKISEDWLHNNVNILNTTELHNGKSFRWY